MGFSGLALEKIFIPATKCLLVEISHHQSMPGVALLIQSFSFDARAARPVDFLPACFLQHAECAAAPCLPATKEESCLGKPVLRIIWAFTFHVG